MVKRKEDATGALLGGLAALAVVVALVAFSGLGGRRAAADAPAFGGEQVSRLVIETEQGPVPFRVQLAATPAMLAQGLMHRRTLAVDAGMLFDFGSERIVTMWMKNTYIPLDMVFIDAAGVVADIAERTEPLSLDIIASEVPVRAVLEVNAGTVARLGIRRGDRVRHTIFPAP